MHIFCYSVARIQESLNEGFLITSSTKEVKVLFLDIFLYSQQDVGWQLRQTVHDEYYFL